MQGRKKINLLAVSIVVFLITGFLFFFVFNRTEKNLKTIDQLELDLQKEFFEHNEIKVLNSYFKSIEKEKSLLESHFIQNSDVVPLLNTLESLATKVEVKAEVSSIDISQDNSGLIVQIKSSGSFGNLYKFIRLLENAPYELEFLSINLNSLIEQDVAGDILQGKWEASIGLRLVSFI